MFVVVVPHTSLMYMRVSPDKCSHASKDVT